MPGPNKKIMSPSEGSDEKQILLIGEIEYATAAWDALSALGKLRVRVSGTMKQNSELHSRPSLWPRPAPF